MTETNPTIQPLPGTDPKLFARFMKRVRITGTCWLWIESGSGKWRRYGSFSIAGQRHAAHRASYEMFCGPIPTGLHILHSCDVGMCVNPAHLRTGTHTDNMRDMAAKKRNVCMVGMQNPMHAHPERAQRGSARWNTNLTENDIVAIRRLYERGMYQQEIATIFNTSQVTISQIVLRKWWKHVT